jgi:PBSX family phage terminase large subunit
MTTRVIYRPSLKARSVFKRRGDARIRFLEGAVRSSKSYTANDLAIKEIQELPPCNVLISGYSITSVARNVLAEWKRAINTNGRNFFRSVREEKDEYIVINWRGLKGKKFYIRGAGKENDYMQIQGATFGYWLADELTRHCESFVDMALSRMSQDFSLATWTTNPDNPLHYVKRRFIDDQSLYVKSPLTGRAELARFTFYLKDNPSLSRARVESLTKLYHGVFKKRYIESQWVMAEGAIYDFFNTDEHVVSRVPKLRRRFVGVDYGTHNPTSFIMFGLPFDASDPCKIYAEREYYYSSDNGGRQKDDSEQACDFCDFVGNTEVHCVIYDPSALSLILAIKKELTKRGKVMMFRKAVNDVVPGIKLVQTFLKNGYYKVASSCTQAIADYGAYIWDVKAGQRGVEEPVKKHDHTKDAERYVLYTLFGNKSIDYIIAMGGS